MDKLTAWMIFILVCIIAILGQMQAMQPAPFVSVPLERQPSSEDLCNTALILYMNRHSAIVNATIAPHIKRRLIEDATSAHHRHYIHELSVVCATHFEERYSPQLETYIQEIVTSSLEDAFRERDKKELLHNQEIETERYKAKLALLSNLGSVALTALVTVYLYSR